MDLDVVSGMTHLQMTHYMMVEPTHVLLDSTLTSRPTLY